MTLHVRNTSTLLLLLTAVTAAAGYARELVLATQFGAGREMDAFYFSWALVQSTHDLLFAGSLGATVLPLLHAHRRKLSLAEPARFVVTTTVLVSLVALFISCVLWLILPSIIDALAPRMSAAVRDTSIAFSEILIWLVPLNALTTAFVFVLNAYNRFILAAIAYLANTVIFIALILLLAPKWGANSLPVAALGGPLITLPILISQVARMGLLYPFRLDMNKEFFGPFWRLSRPLVLSLGIGSAAGLLMGSHLLLRIFATSHREGTIAALGYAFRLYELPISLIANPTGVLVFPTIAALYVKGEMGQIGEICHRILLWGLIVLFPAAVLTWTGADVIVHLLLRWGRFDQEAAQLTAEALRGFAPAVMAEAAVVVLFRVLYALHKSKETVLVALIAVVTLIGLLLATTNAPFVAIPYALSAAYAVAAAVLIIMLVRGVGWTVISDRRQFLCWLLCALFGVAILRTIDWYGTKSLWSELAAVLGFLCSYLAAVSILLPARRREALQMIRSIGAK